MPAKTVEQRFIEFCEKEQFTVKENFDSKTGSKFWLIRIDSGLKDFECFLRKIHMNDKSNTKISLYSIYQDNAIVEKKEITRILSLLKKIKSIK